MLWAAEGRLRGEEEVLVETQASAVLVSAATVWEIEIKRAVGRIQAPEDVGGLVERSGFEPLRISFDHAREAGRLPLLHGDPFDRMLIAQARVEELVLATGDEQIPRYDVPVVKITLPSL